MFVKLVLCCRHTLLVQADQRELKHEMAIGQLTSLASCMEGNLSGLTKRSSTASDRACRTSISDSSRSTDFRIFGKLETIPASNVDFGKGILSWTSVAIRLNASRSVATSLGVA